MWEMECSSEFLIVRLSREGVNCGVMSFLVSVCLGRPVEAVGVEQGSALPGAHGPRSLRSQG